MDDTTAAAPAPHLFPSPTLTLITGVILVILGVAGIILPPIISLATAIFLGWLMVIAGAAWAYHTLRRSRKSPGQWLKAVLLLATGALMLVKPAAGVAALALVITIYLLLDSYGSFALAHILRPATGTGWMTFNGFVSLALAILFLVGWPELSMLLVGIFVGISLLLDGVTLIATAWMARKAA
ncbi:MAG: HdeD family acid-resistance protein [Gemmatimonadota bacterium]